VGGGAFNSVKGNKLRGRVLHCFTQKSFFRMKICQPICSVSRFQVKKNEKVEVKVVILRTEKHTK
jgi:hypothetical protein